MAENRALMNVYETALQAVLEDKKREELRRLVEGRNKELDCLLAPHTQPVVWKMEPCECDPDEQNHCAAQCSYEAMIPNQEGGIIIDADKCVGCTDCIDRCTRDKLSASKDTFAVIEMLQEKREHPDQLVYALVAPAFQGQFSAAVTDGKLRSAFLTAGFDGMIECALFADILTLKEALEFDEKVQDEQSFMLTSCCCPLWIGLIQRHFHEFMDRVPGSVSPMIAAGRTVKKLHPEAKTVFIGPCLAKKKEAREPDLAGAIDAVLTFQETQQIFDALQIDVANLPEDEQDHASRAGRRYARIGGVCEAVAETVRKVSPGSKVVMRTEHADGNKECRAMLSRLAEGDRSANFYEGMHCKGGCVGGPKRIIPPDIGTENVDRFADEAKFKTPADNPYVLELLNRLHMDSIEDLLRSDIFVRKFN